jgi:bacteriocin-like protein
MKNKKKIKKLSKKELKKVKGGVKRFDKSSLKGFEGLGIAKSNYKIKVID